MHCTAQSLIRSAFAHALRRPATVPPAFLIPSLTLSHFNSFSSTAPRDRRFLKKDRNAFRGVSALRHTGLGRQQNLRAHVKNLPKPVLDPFERSAVEVDEDHGLWGFFLNKEQSLQTPMEISEHGRAWTVPELRLKDWNDLHRLWWMCCRERNRLETAEAERARIGHLYGEYEKEARVTEIALTMKAIRHVLTERWYAWENARVAAMEDDQVDLYADPSQGGQAYLVHGGPMKEAMPDNDATERTKSSDSPVPPNATQPSPEARI